MKHFAIILMLLALAGGISASDMKARGRAAWALAVASVKTSDETSEKPSTARDIVTPLNDIWRHTQGTLYYEPIRRPYTSQPCVTGT